jgi:extracellular elastinolytic metalloproteinase
MRISILSLLLVCTSTIFIFAQKQSALDIALRYIEKHHDQWDLTPEDVSDLAVSDQYQSRHNGVTHLFFKQQYQNIPVFNALIGIHVSARGQVAYATSTFVPNLAEKINTTSIAVSAQEAVRLAADHLKLELMEPLQILDSRGKTEVTLNGAGIARAPIVARLVFQPLRNGALRLAWELSIDQINSADYWNLRFDAQDGRLLGQGNYTIHCRHGDPSAHLSGEACLEERSIAGRAFVPAQEALLMDNAPPPASAQYRVFPIPVESPAHGDQQLVSNPADSIASPFGWHDTNGLEGPEYTITRGNNVHAFLDPNDMDVSSKDEPDGGEELIFDFPFDPAKEPDSVQNAAVTQLFYMNNIMHDFVYQYGFDEQAGNFQQNNYGKKGDAGDPVKANAQDGGSLGNANFTSPPDGEAGRMQMYLWTNSNSRLLSITAPATLAGSLETGPAVFGPEISTEGITGRVVRAFDNSTDPGKVCGAVINPEEVSGNIAMIDRGICFFEEKVNHAEAAGAVAVIICNYEDDVITMGGASDIPDPGIPAVMLQASDCQRIDEFLTQGVEVNLQKQNLDGPAMLDGDFDNGIIAHEYGHGISSRLTGGPSNSNCLFNDEQMGEGWSDFFTLVTTYQPGKQGADPRGIGSYVLSSDLSSAGIRRLPYSTNTTLNDYTFDDVIGTRAPHDLGEVWASMLWDLYWAFIDKYGWDDDLYNGTGGNNMAIQLVIDGMKIQNCDPGFIDARDAIIVSDIVNNGGDNQCLIWEVFARRGLGWNAEQGSTEDRNDGRQSFETMPECIKELKIAKRATELINAGDDIVYTLRVTNHKDEPATGVIVTDILPAGTDFIGGSTIGADPPEINGNELSFDIGTLRPGESIAFSYKASSAVAMASVRQFLDSIENGDLLWTLDALAGFDFWEITEEESFSGDKAWFVPNTLNENDQVLQLLDPILITGNQPVLRFYHRYDTEPGLDAGIVEISTDEGANWEIIPREKIFKNSYRGKLAYETFSLPSLEGYWGEIDNFVPSYVDLSDYQGEEITIRFRFGSVANSSFDDDNVGKGWFVDDVEIMDMVNYNSEACVSSEQGDLACTEVHERGTIVQAGEVTTSVDDPLAGAPGVRIYPNPARDWINIAVHTNQFSEAHIELMSLEGRILRRLRTDLTRGEQIIPLRTGDLAPGLYLVRLQNAGASVVRKVVVE